VGKYKAGNLETLGCTPIFQQFTNDELLRLASVGQRRTYRRREVIFHQGDPADRLYVIEAGCVALSMCDTESARVAMLEILAPGAIFGDLAVGSVGTSSFTAEAIGPVTVVALPRAYVQSVLWTHPEAIELLFHLMSEQIHSLAELVSDRSFLGLEERLAKALLLLAHQHGQRMGEEVELRMPMTQSDLASLLGAARTSVNRILGSYEDMGLIRRPSSRVTFVDVQRLEQRIN
jgi:CRP/FNR family transcriptional regulator, cyclic AMP receptor protein